MCGYDLVENLTGLMHINEPVLLPETKVAEGNVFRGVCQSFCPEVGFSGSMSFPGGISKGEYSGDEYLK